MVWPSSSRKRARFHTIGMVSPPPVAGMYQPQSRSVASRISVCRSSRSENSWNPPTSPSVNALTMSASAWAALRQKHTLRVKVVSCADGSCLLRRSSAGAGSRSPAPLGTPSIATARAVARNRGRASWSSAGTRRATLAPVARGVTGPTGTLLETGKRGVLLGKTQESHQSHQSHRKGSGQLHTCNSRTLIVHEDYDAVAAPSVRHTDARDQAPRQADRLRGSGGAVAAGPGGLSRPLVRRRRGRGGDGPPGRPRPRRARRPARRPARPRRAPSGRAGLVPAAGHDRLRRLRRPVRGHPGRRRPEGVVPRGPRRRLPAPDAPADPATRPERRRLRGAGLPLRPRATSARSRTCAR